MAERGSRPTWVIARREVRDATGARSFQITLVLSVIAVAAIIVIAKLVGGGDDEAERVVVADTPGAEGVDVQALAAGIGVDVEVSVAGDDAAAEAAVLDGDADVAVLDGGAQLATREDVDDTSRLGALVNVLRADLALQRGLRDAGLDAEQAAAVRTAEPPPVVALAPDDGVDERRTGTATVTNILLFLMLQVYGGWVLIAVTREKASRVVEVLLAVVRPIQLLVGKIVGIGLVALGHAALLIATAIVATRVVGTDLTSGLSIGDLALGGVWFLLGYALYCSAFAAAGSLCARVEDAQGVSFPILLPLLFAYIVSFSAVGGASTLLWVLAFLPPTAVLAMPTLYAIGEAPLGAVALSMALTVVATVGVARLAAAVYERTVMHTGRKLSWREAVRARRELGPTASGRPAAAD